MTSKFVKIRLKEHNEGTNSFTRFNRPWDILYYEQNYCKECAQKRETFLKTGQGRRIIKLIGKGSVSTKGRSASG